MACVCAHIGAASAGCVHTGTSLMLDEDDFEDKVVKSDALITFVEFSSPWCIWAIPNANGHGDCATMRKAWDKLATTYRERDLVEIAEVDCSRFVHHPPEPDGSFKSRESLCQRFEIKSYPTVIVFDGASGVNGTEYKGGHTYDEMHGFLETEHAKLCEVSADEAHVPESKCEENEVEFLGEWRTKTPAEADKELHREGRTHPQWWHAFGSETARCARLSWLCRPREACSAARRHALQRREARLDGQADEYTQAAAQGAPSARGEGGALDRLQLVRAPGGSSFDSLWRRGDHTVSPGPVYVRWNITLTPVYRTLGESN